MRPVLEDLIGEGLVKYHYITNKSLPGYPHLDVAPGHSLNWQTPVFRTCLHHYGAQHRWMGERALRWARAGCWVWGKSQLLDQLHADWLPLALCKPPSLPPVVALWPHCSLHRRW